MPAAEATLMTWIAQQGPRMLTLVEQWSALNSGSHHVRGLRRMTRALLKAFACLRGTRHTLQLPALPSWDNQGQPFLQEYGEAIVIRQRLDAPVRVLLGGHMDTVFAADSPFQTTYWQGRDRLYGPGVADMKAGLAILLIALQALEMSPYAGQIGWDILITPDEEIGSLASYALWRQYAWQNNYALLFEPALPDGALVSMRKGSFNYVIIAEGMSAHAGRDFAKGRNAVAALAQLTVAAHALTQADLTVNIGMLQGGTAANIVPDHAHCLVNMRAADLTTLLQAERTLEATAEQVQRTTGVLIHIHQRSRRLPKPLDPATEALLATAKTCTELLDIPFAHRPVGGVCDGNIVAAEGIATLDSLGAVGDGLHTFQEYIYVPSLVERAQLATLLLCKLAQQAPPPTKCRATPAAPICHEAPDESI